MLTLHFVKNILIPEQEKGITLRGTGQAPVQKYWKELLKKIESGEFDPTIILFSCPSLPFSSGSICPNIGQSPGAG